MCYISYNLKKKTKNEIFIVFCFWKLAQLGGPGLVLWKVAVRALAGAGSPVVLKVMVVHWYFADYVFGSGAVICS